MSEISSKPQCQNHYKTQIVKSKSEKHRRRNKRRLMKRKLKKIKLKSKSLFCKLTVGKLESSPVEVRREVTMPVNNYEWEQYRSNILSWQYKHEIAYWKSKAEALNYENKVLHSVIESMCKSKSHETVNIKNHPNQQYSGEESHSEHEERDNYSESDSEESEIHFSDDVLAFLQKSAAHRQERDKNRLAEEEQMETANTEEVNVPREMIDNKRRKEIELLYGESSKNIDGFETMVQLNFDRFMDLNKPVMWPNIPLKLN